MNSSRTTEFEVALSKRDLIAAAKSLFSYDVAVQALPATGNEFDRIEVEKYAGGVKLVYRRTFMLDRLSTCTPPNQG